MSYRGYGALRNGLVLDALCSEGAGVNTRSTKKNTLYLAPRKYVQNVATVPNDWNAGGCLEVPFPPGSTSLKLIANGVDYDLVGSVFTDPTEASTNLTVESNNGADNTQNIVIYGIVAGALVSESIELTDTTPAAGALDFTEVIEAFLDDTCAGIITIKDSEGNTLGTIAVGRRIRSPDIFKRIGEHGNDIILPMNLGTEFVGEVLGGQWKKDWDDNIDVFTARINGVVSGMLEMGGVAGGAGVWGRGWMNNHHPFVMMNEAELTVEMEIPTSDTGVVATRDLSYEFFIRRQKELNRPLFDDDYLYLNLSVNDNGLLLFVQKRVAAGTTTLWNGSTADGTSLRDPATDKFWILRFVFHDGVIGDPAPGDVRHMHVYAKHGNSRVNAEAAGEEELFDTVGGQASPYDISDLLFNVGYLTYEIRTQNTTWFGSSVGSGDEAISTYLRASYPNFQKSFVCAAPSVGSVELWDGDPDGAGVQVFDEDHDFGTNDIYLQNGLIQVHIDQGTANHPQLYLYYSGAWHRQTDALTFQGNIMGYASFPILRGIKSCSPEKTTIQIRGLVDAGIPDDNFVDYELTMRRGSTFMEMNPLQIFPLDELVFYARGESIYRYPRFGFVGDDEIADNQAKESGLNTTLTDNFIFTLDPNTTTQEGLVVYSLNKKPDGALKRMLIDGYSATVRTYIQYIKPSDIENTIIYVGASHFPLVNALFLEAEDGTLGGGAARLFGEPAGASTFVRAQSANPADVGQVLTIWGNVGGFLTMDMITLNGVAWVNGDTDFARVYILELDGATAGNITVEDSLGNPIHVIPAATTLVSNAVLLTAVADRADYEFRVQRDLPAGRYIAFYRTKDTNQIAGDSGAFIRNLTDGTRREEENAANNYTSTASYLYYSTIFDILEEDVAGQDNFTVAMIKRNPAANTIYVDYFLIVPIGDGKNWPKDLSRVSLGRGTGDGTDDLWTEDDRGINALDTDAVRQYMTLGVSEDIRTVSCRIKLNAASQGVVELAPGKYITAVSNVLSATGFDNNVTFYVNGRQTTAIAHGEYVDLIIEMDGDEYAASLQFGLVNGTLNVVDVARAMAWTRVLEGFEKRMVDEMRRLQ